ncbi:hypothetical protein yc1106_04688 [Curvularia clavata]|uniref:Uncharacterized protein n=1 Tax=Curvularia clavata TaxID=95742 RepID=A0A9Q8Z7H1_CURCL|nr:hypothetical protein yc1106_04688 [Curvularia clavata]
MSSVPNQQEKNVNTNTSASQHEEKDQETKSSQPLPLPEPSTSTNGTTQLNVGGQAVKLDHLGPLVVNKDGTLSRIANWETMTEIERQNTLRILVKRNQIRTEALKEAAGNQEK